MLRAPHRSTAATRPRRMAAPSASRASGRANRRTRPRHPEPLPDKVDVPSTDSPRPIQPSPLGHVPDKAASGITVKTGLRAKTGPTIEMSPRALARARSPLMPITSTAHTTTAGHAKRGSANGWPLTRKYTPQLPVATACVHVTITRGGMARARPFTTANWAAWVSAAPNASANQFTRPPRRAKCRPSALSRAGPAPIQHERRERHHGLTRLIQDAARDLDDADVAPAARLDLLHHDIFDG